MLSFSLLRNHAGIQLEGDYTSLRALCEVTHDINDRSPFVKNVEGILMGLAYDARKAFERQRETISPPEHWEEIGPRYGVKILWPVLLLQHTMLRASLGFIDNRPKHQAVLYMLEDVIENALKQDFGSNSDAIIRAWKGSAGSASFFEERANTRCALYSSWTAGMRKAGLAELLNSMSPMFDSLTKLRDRRGLVTPEALAQWEDAEWPDPKW